MIKNIGISVILVLLISACSSYNKISELPFVHKDPEVKRVLDKAFLAAGTMERYQNIETISYKKRSILYHSDGSTESDVTQFHEYSMSPELSATIFWMTDGQRHSIKYENGGAKKYIDGEFVAGSEESATKTFHSAHYVLFMPFKLADDNVLLKYDGKVELENGTTADVIKAVYEPSVYDNHSTDDTWWYYFDADTGAYLASMAYHAPTYAYIENTAKNEGLPLIMNTYRKTFRVDKDRNREYLRGEFFYEDYEMTFKN